MRIREEVKLLFDNKILYLNNPKESMVNLTESISELIKIRKHDIKFNTQKLIPFIYSNKLEHIKRIQIFINIKDKIYDKYKKCER